MKTSVKRKWIAGWMLLAGILAFGACKHAPAGESTGNLQRPDKEAAGEEVHRSRSATVRSLQLQVLESFPVKIGVTLSGVLPDGCTRIEEIETIREGNAFHLRLYTERPADAMCTMALVPFEQTVTMDTAGLPPGGYTVHAGELTATFRLGSSGGRSSDLAPEDRVTEHPRTP